MDGMRDAGTALGAVGAVVLDAAPEIGRWLFGADGAAVQAAVQGVVATMTGTSDPAAQVAALADPDAAARLRVALAAIVAQHATAADARLAAQMMGAQGNGGAMAWGAPVVSLVVLATFGCVVTLVLLHGIPSGSSEAVLNVLLGTLGAMATNVVGYWVGSSAGSARKDERLARQSGFM